MTANEEFAAEVSRLYEEEERWNQERQRLEAEMESVNVSLQKQLEDSEEQWEEERRRLECQEQRLLESVKMLSQDNAKLIKEKQDEHISQSKSHQVELSPSNTELSVVYVRYQIQSPIITCKCSIFRIFNHNLSRKE